MLSPSQSKLPIAPKDALDPREAEGSDRGARIVACEHADRCGGCPAIALPYAEQLALKQARVVEATAKYPALEDVRTEKVVGAEAVVEYRTRAKLIVAPGGRIGLFGKGGGHQVVDI